MYSRDYNYIMFDNVYYSNLIDLSTVVLVILDLCGFKLMFWKFDMESTLNERNDLDAEFNELPDETDDTPKVKQKM